MAEYLEVRLKCLTSPKPDKSPDLRAFWRRFFGRSSWLQKQHKVKTVATPKVKAAQTSCCKQAVFSFTGSVTQVLDGISRIFTRTHFGISVPKEVTSLKKVDATTSRVFQCGEIVVEFKEIQFLTDYPGWKAPSRLNQAWILACGRGKCIIGVSVVDGKDKREKLQPIFDGYIRAFAKGYLVPCVWNLDSFIELTETSLFGKEYRDALDDVTEHYPFSKHYFYILKTLARSNHRVHITLEKLEAEVVRMCLICYEAALAREDSSVGVELFQGYVKDVGLPVFDELYNMGSDDMSQFLLDWKERRFNRVDLWRAVTRWTRDKFYSVPESIAVLRSLMLGALKHYLNGEVSNWSKPTDEELKNMPLPENRIQLVRRRITRSNAEVVGFCRWMLLELIPNARPLSISFAQSEIAEWTAEKYGRSFLIAENNMVHVSFVIVNPHVRFQCYAVSGVN